MPLPGLTLCQVAIHTDERMDSCPPERSAIRSSAIRYGGVHRRVAGDIRAVQRLERPFLHAARLVFTHPRDGRRMEFTAPLPDDLQDVLTPCRTKKRSKKRSEDGDESRNLIDWQASSECSWWS